MSFPSPTPGLVIRYSFLWSSDAAGGADEGRKDRPCAVIVAVPDEHGAVRTVVAPITHAEPSDLEASLELPLGVARELGLDGSRHWIRLDELNRFLWPGYDLRPIPGTGRYAYGMLPRPLFEEMKRRILALAKARRARTQLR